MQLIRKQKILGKYGLFFFVALINMVGPLTTDTYLPSLPQIAIDFNISTTEASSTILVYFFFLACGIILIGPSSDKFGRKKPLLLSIALYTVASFVCYFQENYVLFVICRCCQGLAAGGMVSITTAIIKDSYAGKSRGIILAFLQAIFLIAPIIAPLIGAAIISVFEWHFVFLVLSMLGCFMFLLGCLYQETITEEEIVKDRLYIAYFAIFRIIKNKRFTFLLLMASCIAAPLMGYLGSASFIYQSNFGLSASEFSMFFALSSSVSIIGSILVIFVTKSDSKNKVFVFTTICLVPFFASTILMFVIGTNNPWTFFASYCLYGLAASANRPFLTDVLLSQHDGDTGSATALLNFIINIFGSCGILMGSLPWSSPVLGLATTMAIYFVLTVVFWIVCNTVPSCKYKTDNI